MNNNKKGNAVIGIILLVIGGIIILFNILSIVGVGLLQNDFEKEKQRSIAVDGIVDNLRYDSSSGHYVADVYYEVDGKYYKVTLDTATSNNKPGTTMTVYCYASDPSHVVDEWNSKETYQTYHGYNDQQFNSYDPNIPFGSDRNSYPQSPYPGQQQNTYDPASQFNPDDSNRY